MLYRRTSHFRFYLRSNISEIRTDNDSNDQSWDDEINNIARYFIVLFLAMKKSVHARRNVLITQWKNDVRDSTASLKIMKLVTFYEVLEKNSLLCSVVTMTTITIEKF